MTLADIKNANDIVKKYEESLKKWFYSYKWGEYNDMTLKGWSQFHKDVATFKLRYTTSPRSYEFSRSDLPINFKYGSSHTVRTSCKKIDNKKTE